MYFLTFDETNSIELKLDIVPTRGFSTYELVNKYGYTIPAQPFSPIIILI